MKLYHVDSLVRYFNDRDNDYVSYDPEWTLVAKMVNKEVWYECWYKCSDILASDYDYSSRDLREVLEYMNSCTGDVLYY